MVLSPHAPPQRIPLWKLVGGGALHTLAPAYVLALGVDGWLFARRGAAVLDAWLAHVPGMSLRFLMFYAAAGLGATGLAALADGFAARRLPADTRGEGELLAAQHLRLSLAQGRGCFGAQGDAVLERICALRPDLADSLTQALLRDVWGMVEAGREAVQATAPQPSDLAMTVAALDRLAAALEERQRDREDLARDRALVMATYVEARYGTDKIQDNVK